MSYRLCFDHHFLHYFRKRTERLIFTGWNEVLAKVIFSQACVILSTGRGGGLGNIFTSVCHSVHRGGVSEIFRGVSEIFGGMSEILGGVSEIWGVSKIFRGGFWNFRGGGVLHRNTVNVRPVRILLECILILQYFYVMCELHHKNSLNPSLNGKKNCVKNITPKPGISWFKKFEVRVLFSVWNAKCEYNLYTGWARLIRSHSSARFSFELSGNSN